MNRYRSHGYKIIDGLELYEKDCDVPFCNMLIHPDKVDTENYIKEGTIITLDINKSYEVIAIKSINLINGDIELEVKEIK